MFSINESAEKLQVLTSVSGERHKAKTKVSLLQSKHHISLTLTTEFHLSINNGTVSPPYL